MRRFLAIVKKEFRQIRRDPLSLGLLIFVPALLLAMYGYALSFDVKHITVGVLNEDGTPESRELLDSLFRNPYFDHRCDLQSIHEADDLLNYGRVRAVLVVPHGYAKRLLRGETTKLQLLVDASDANTASAAIGYMDALADRLTRQVEDPRIWFNPELESARFLVPGLIGMLLMLSAVIATSLSIVREKERETMEQLMVSPLRPAELIAGKTFPYVIVCIATMAGVLFLGYALFGVVVRGSFLLLGVATVLFLYAALGMGVFISAITRTQQMAFQVAAISSLLPSIILSGLIFPIHNMPLPVQAMSLVVVPRYFVGALRGIILKGASLREVWPEFLGMFVLGCLFNLLAAHRTRKSA